MIALVQCLCEKRHGIMALAFNEEAHKAEDIERELVKTINDLKASGALRDACGICGSKNWHYELGTTKWNTMEEAQPHLERAVAQAEAIRAFFKAAKN